MRDDEPGHSDPEHAGDAEREFSIARSNALVPLLVLFAATVLAIVVTVVRA